MNTSKLYSGFSAISILYIWETDLQRDKIPLSLCIVPRFETWGKAVKADFQLTLKIKELFWTLFKIRQELSQVLCDLRVVFSLENIFLFEFCGLRYMHHSFQSSKNWSNNTLKPIIEIQITRLKDWRDAKDLYLLCIANFICSSFHAYLTKLLSFSFHAHLQFPAPHPIWCCTGSAAAMSLSFPGLQIITQLTTLRGLLTPTTR